MRKPVIIFVSVISIPLIIVGFLVYRAFNPKTFVDNHYQRFYLKTDEMEEADTAILNNSYGSYISSAYKFDGKSTIKEIGADAFLYVINNDSLNLTSDTVLLLDARLNRPWEQHIENFLQYIEPQKSLKGCMVSIPKQQIPIVKKYKYLYAHIDLVSED
jgi:hypothetical protein